jgi:hypothetical protein
MVGHARGAALVIDTRISQMARDDTLKRLTRIIETRNLSFTTGHAGVTITNFPCTEKYIRGD